MNDCTLYDIQLAAYAAGELSEPELGAVESHLARCAECRDELAREIDMRTMLAGLPQVPCPQRVSVAVYDTLARTQTETMVGPWRRWSLGPALVAATLLAVLLVPTMWQKTSPPDPTVANVGAGTPQFTTAEIKQARREVIATLVLAADILDRSRDKTVVDVFGARLPRAISESLRPHATDAQNSTHNPNAPHTGGNG